MNRLFPRKDLARLGATALVGLFLLPLTACGDDDDDDNGDDTGNPPGADVDEGPEIFTTLELTFSPDGGTAADDLVTTFQDDDGDGVMSGTITPEMTMLAASTTYTLSLRLANTTLPEDDQDEPQEEVMEEDDEHQFFFFGEQINGPATDNMDAPITHEYADDDGALPVGFISTITTDEAADAGDFTVLLRHLPPADDGTVIKVDGLAEDLAASGDPADLPGETDISVTFSVGVE